MVISGIRQRYIVANSLGIVIDNKGDFLFNRFFLSGDFFLICCNFFIVLVCFGLSNLFVISLRLFDVDNFFLSGLVVSCKQLFTGVCVLFFISIV